MDKCKLVTAGKYAAAILSGLVLSSFLFLIPAPSPALSPAPSVDILDEPSREVLDAVPEIRLVQWGTRQPFTGNGVPGLDVTFRSTASAWDWSVVAWANTTKPSGDVTCQGSGLFFGIHDWSYMDEGDSWRFMSMPSTVPQRILGPEGDQCLVHAQATETWHVRLCVEGKPGGPREPYAAEDGWHIDYWDRCIEKDFEVES